MLETHTIRICKVSHKVPYLFQSDKGLDCRVQGLSHRRLLTPEIATRSVATSRHHPFQLTKALQALPVHRKNTPQTRMMHGVRPNWSIQPSEIEVHEELRALDAIFANSISVGSVFTSLPHATPQAQAMPLRVANAALY